MPIFLGVLCIGSQSNIAPIIRLESWPTDKNGFPLVASKRAQTLTYGDAHWQVCPSPLLFLLPSHVHLLSSSPSDSNFLFFSFQRYLAYFQLDRVQNGPPWGLGTTVPQIWTPKSAGTPEV